MYRDEMRGKLKGNVSVEVAFKKGTLDKLSAEEQNRCAVDITDDVLSALDQYVSIDDTLSGEDYVDNEQTFVSCDELDEVNCLSITVFQSCNVWADPSVGIPAATDDNIKIPAVGFCTELKKLLKSNKFGVADALQFVKIDIDDEGLVETYDLEDTCCEF